MALRWIRLLPQPRQVLQELPRLGCFVGVPACEGRGGGTALAWLSVVRDHPVSPTPPVGGCFFDASTMCNVPVTPVCYAGITRDGHPEYSFMTQRVGLWRPDPSVGSLTLEGVVPKFSDTPGEVRRAAPLIDEHNEYVFGEVLGLSRRRIDELQQAEVFF